MKRILLTCLLLVSLIGLSFCQIDDTYRKTLKELYRASHAMESVDAVIKQMFTMFRSEYNDVPDEIWDDLEKEFNKATVDNLIEMLVPVYLKHLSIEDLQELIVFYESPVGKKYAEKNPLIMQESMQVGQLWGQRIGAEFLKKLQEKGYNE
jgi:hypothetical protein